MPNKTPQLQGPLRSRPRPADQAGRLGEELRAARREQVHVHRAPGREQGADPRRGRAALRRQGDGCEHDQPQGQAQADPRGDLRSPRLHQARHCVGRPAADGRQQEEPHRHLRGSGLLRPAPRN